MCRNGHVAYQATLSKTIAEGDSANIHVTVWLTHFLTPFPEEIEQRDSQLVILAANLYVATPYETKSQVRACTQYLGAGPGCGGSRCIVLWQ